VEGEKNERGNQNTQGIAGKGTGKDSIISFRREEKKRGRGGVRKGSARNAGPRTIRQLQRRFTNG